MGDREHPDKLFTSTCVRRCHPSVLRGTVWRHCNWLERTKRKREEKENREKRTTTKNTHTNSSGKQNICLGVTYLPLKLMQRVLKRTAYKVVQDMWVCSRLWLEQS